LFYTALLIKTRPGLPVQRFAMGWTVQGSNPSTRKRFSLLQNRPDWLWTHLVSC